MIIESSVHFDGAREQIRRYRESLELSSQYMDSASLTLLTAQINREIERLQAAIEVYKAQRSVEIVSTEWFTLPLSTDICPVKSYFADFGAKTLVLTAPLRQTAENLVKRPANSAGLSLSVVYG